MKKLISLLLGAISLSLMGMDDIEQREYEHLDSNAQAQLALVYRFNLKGDQGPVKTYYLFNDAHVLQQNLQQHRDNLSKLVTTAPILLNQKATNRFTHGAVSLLTGMGIFIKEVMFPSAYSEYALGASALCLLHSYRAVNQGYVLKNYARSISFDIKNRREVTDHLLRSLEEHGTTPFNDQQLHDGTL